MRKKNKKVRTPKMDYHDAKRRAIINLSEAKRNIYGSAPEKNKTY